MISVIIPLYNKESRIAVTLLSVLNQKGRFEIVVVDDGSTDKSTEIVNKFNDERIRLFRQKNGGPSKARNKGVSEAKGDWILFLDADDELLPDSIILFEKLIEKYPREKCITCNFYTNINKNNRLYSICYTDKIVKQTFWAWNFRGLYPRTGASIFHKDIVNKYKFDERLRRYEDAEWLFRIMGDYYFVRCSKPVMIYYLGSAEASAKRKDISDDYLGYLNFETESIGKKLAIFRLYLQAKSIYPEEVRSLYTNKFSFVEKNILFLLYWMSLFYSRWINFLVKVYYLFLHDKRNI